MVDAVFEPRFRNARLRQRRRVAADSFSDFLWPLLPKQGFRPGRFRRAVRRCGKLTIYCPDAIDLDSFYNKGIHPADRMRTHNAYENVIVHDVFDLARREVQSSIASASAVRVSALIMPPTSPFGIPTLVSHLISLSGAFDISRFLRRLPRRQHLFQQPLRISAEHARPVEISITWGSSSGPANGITRATNRIRLSGILNSKGIRHWLDDRKWCGHDWNYWRDMLPYYLSKFEPER